MSECIECGGEVENKNAAGHYRDKCCDCIINTADSDPRAARPIAGCECDDCEAAKT